MSLSVGKTFNRGKEIGRMFPQGIEAKEVWYRGNRIFLLSGGQEPEKIEVPRNLGGDTILRLGDYVVFFNSVAVSSRRFTFHRFKNGRYVDSVELAYSQDTSSMLLTYNLYNSKLVMIEEVMKDGNIRIYTYAGGDDFRYVTLSEEARKTRPSLNTTLAYYLDGTNRLFLGHVHYNVSSSYSEYPILSNDDRLHCKFRSVSIVLNEKFEPVAEELHDIYGIDPDVEVPTQTEAVYKLRHPILKDRFVQDLQTGIIYANVITHLVRKMDGRYLYWKARWGTYMVTMDGVYVTTGALLSDEHEENWDNGYTSPYIPDQPTGKYWMFGSRTFNGKKYNIARRGNNQERCLAAMGVIPSPTYQDDEVVWIPGEFLIYNENKEEYYIATSKYVDITSEIEHYPGIQKSKFIDDSGKPYYLQEPHYEQVTETPDISNEKIKYICSDDKGIYLFYYVYETFSYYYEVYFVPFEAE